MLAKAPAAISLKEIVDAIDPSLLAFNVSSDGESGPAVAHSWNSLTSDFQKNLSYITLEQLSSTPGGSMFYI